MPTRVFILPPTSITVCLRFSCHDRALASRLSVLPAWQGGWCRHDEGAWLKGEVWDVLGRDWALFFVKE